MLNAVKARGAHGALRAQRPTSNLSAVASAKEDQPHLSQQMHEHDYEHEHEGMQMTMEMHSTIDLADPMRRGRAHQAFKEVQAEAVASIGALDAEGGLGLAWRGEEGGPCIF